MLPVLAVLFVPRKPGWLLQVEDRWVLRVVIRSPDGAHDAGDVVLAQAECLGVLDSLRRGGFGCPNGCHGIVVDLCDLAESFLNVGPGVRCHTPIVPCRLRMCPDCGQRCAVGVGNSKELVKVSGWIQDQNEDDDITPIGILRSDGSGRPLVGFEVGWQARPNVRAFGALNLRHGVIMMVGASSIASSEHIASAQLDSRASEVRGRSRLSARRMAGLAVAGSIGAVSLLMGTATDSFANYPGPPPALLEEEQQGVVPFGLYENAPATCPDSVPTGTVHTATPFKEVCEKAVRTAPTPEAAAAIRYAFSKLGSPYSQSLRHSISPPIFDCSSFIARAYDAANATIYRDGEALTWFRNDYTFSWTGAYMPINYLGSNLVRLNSKDELQPGDILIQFEGSSPANSAGNAGHAQMWLGDGLVIQSGGDHPTSVVNVWKHTNGFDNEWYFRYTSTPQISPIFRKWTDLGGSTGMPGPAVDATTDIGGGFLMRRYENAWIYWSQNTGAKAVYGPALQRYSEINGHSGPLGPATADPSATSVAGTTVNRFVGGAIYTAANTGANEVFGGIWSRYSALGADRSALGVPTGRETAGPVDGSVQQEFTRGTMYYSAGTGAQPVTGVIDTRFRTAGVADRIGLPIGVAVNSGGGTAQRFQRGALYTSPTTGTHEVYGGIYLRYLSSGAERSTLGLPTSIETDGPTPGSRMQSFQGGTIFWSPADGAHIVSGAFQRAYDDVAADGSSMGVPTAAAVNIPGGQMQTFTFGALYYLADGRTFAVRHGMWQRYASIGAHTSPMGLPLGPERDGSAPGVRVQDFQSGSLYWSGSTGAQDVYGGIGAAYRLAGGESSSIGLPTTGETAGPLPGSRMNLFQRGAIVWSPATGAHVMSADVTASYFGQSLFNAIGLPVAGDRAGGVAGSRVQNFQRGRMYTSAATGAHAVWGGILMRYEAMGSERSAAGLPTSSEISAGPAGTRKNTFVNGAIYWSASTGAQEVLGALNTRYVEIGGPRSVVGMPTGSATGITGGMTQPFSNGALYWSSSGGVREVYGGIYATYRALGAHTSPLGLPTGSEEAGPIAGSRMNQFAGGAIYWSPPTGAHAVYGSISGAYLDRKLAPVIGLPTAGERNGGVNGSRVQEFQRGTMYWSAGTGAHEVYGGIREMYRLMGAERSTLGLPTSGEYSTNSGRANNFVNGRIDWNARTGALTVTTK